MKIVTTLLAMTLLISSCADSSKRQQYLQKLYPHSRVEPSTGLIQQNGYEFIVIDSTMQIVAVQFYPGSETKIQSLRNIR
jgi:PBP1b-binding outer membrane lipoprotein LpoB